MYQAFKNGVIGSQNDIKLFRNQWHSQEIKSILEYTKQSLEKNPDLTPSLNVPRWGWMESQTKEKETAKCSNNSIQKKEDAFEQLTNEDVLRMITEFQKTYPGIQVLYKDNNQDLMVCISITTEFSTAHRNLVQIHDRGPPSSNPRRD